MVIDIRDGAGYRPATITSARWGPRVAAYRESFESHPCGLLGAGQGTI